jgi:multidrug efflux pump subunit AcrA (membrane-fusion protein)
VPVTIGHDFGNSVEITSGVKTTDEVILDPADSLANGIEVRPQMVNSKGRS